MYREVNGKPLELLAPAGTFEIFKGVINAACDAVYCGGQILNMRLIRKGYNLKDEELKEAVYLANERGKKIYITVNTLLDSGELAQTKKYLDFLEEIKPHGLIIQDTALLDLVRQKGISIPLHSSVMMNVHNLDMIRFLEKQGITRVVLSREMSLREVKSISLQTNMELEYFTHGDMCVTHGSQCLYSSALFGMSSNRGRCLKPCRWAFSRPGCPEEKPFPLAVKDLSLYSHLSDMILAGISSFKIEGRMRQKEFIVDLINRYGTALDRFLEDPLAGSYPESDSMDPFKKRDYSTAYAFGNPGIDNINSRGEGTGQFYSTGKMFSTPAEEKEIVFTPEKSAPEPPRRTGSGLKMSVRVNSAAQAGLALKRGADRIYISAEPFAPEKPLSLEKLNGLARECRDAGTELYLGLPRMMSDEQCDLFRFYFSKDPGVSGVLAGHSGILEMVDPKECHIICDTPMNIYNSQAVKFYTDRGASEWTPSLELPYKSLLELPAGAVQLGCKEPGEIVLHGLPTMMYMDHDVSRTKEALTELVTPVSRLILRRDWWNRYHLLAQKELTLLPKLPELIENGYRRFRLELQAYNIEASEEIIKFCRTCLDDPARVSELLTALTPRGGGFTYGAHQF